MGDDYDNWRITLPHIESAKFAAALASHRDALFAQWTRDHDGRQPDDDERRGQVPDNEAPVPTNLDAFLRLIEHGWDTEATARPHGQHTTVVVHLDLATKIANLHLGPLLPDADRQYLTCDATCEVWFHRDGTLIGAGHRTRTINRRLHRALEHRDHTCVVPGCAATCSLHAHHLIHWDNGGPTELWNLVLVCPYHHRLHHRGVITITGPADRLKVTDAEGEELFGGSLAHPPQNPPPAVARYPGPTGERANWWWYNPLPTPSTTEHPAAGWRCVQPNRVGIRPLVSRPGGRYRATPANRPDCPATSARQRASNDSRVLAGDRDDLSGQITRVVAGQERNGGRDLPRFGSPAECLTAGQPVQQVGQATFSRNL